MFRILSSWALACLKVHESSARLHLFAYKGNKEVDSHAATPSCITVANHDFSIGLTCTEARM